MTASMEGATETIVELPPTSGEPDTGQEVPEDAPPVTMVSEPAGPPPSESAPEDSTADIDRIDPPPDSYTLSDGTVVFFERLRTRQFFKLLRIVTHGAMDTIGFLRIDAGMSNEEFTSRLVAVILFAIPDAEEETLDFLRTMVYPAEPNVPADTPPAEVAKRAQAMKAVAQRQLDAAFENPELDDTMGLVEAIVRREAPDLKALGKRLASMIALARKTGQIPGEANSSPQTDTSPGASPEPST